MTTKTQVFLTDMLKGSSVDPKAARRKLRKAFPDHTHNTSWTFTKGSKDHKKALELIGVTVAAE